MSIIFLWCLTFYPLLADAVPDFACGDLAYFFMNTMKQVFAGAVVVNDMHVIITEVMLEVANVVLDLIPHTFNVVCRQ